MSVWGPSPDELYAVGGQPQPGGGLILRYDGGGDWLPETLPADTPMLDWVFGPGAGDGRIWAVGRAGAIMVREGGVWSAEASPTTKILWGVWGFDEGELWAVGGNGVSDVPVLLRRDGQSQSWSEVVYPDLGVDCYGLFKVWGMAADDVWVVGDRGATLHYDGVDWSAHPTAQAIDLISLWGSDAEGWVAVGGRSNGRIARLEGQEWNAQTLAISGLNGVWVDPDGPITLVGVGGTILSLTPGSFEVVAEDSPTQMVLHAVFGFSGGPRYAVGGSLLQPPPYVGIILAYD
ncbi:MAG: hypothetical protein KC457_16415 [Myxococcales bacterium]|nr:hypothetical protein [Myxococcales bacterium]